MGYRKICLSMERRLIFDKRGVLSQRQLAKKFNIARSTVSDIQNYKIRADR
jgi:predicted XRE-type DNA-binding protein